MIRVMIVDDHQVFREGLVKLVETDKSIRVVCTASNGVEALAKTEIPDCMPIDVAVIDITMPEMNGLELIKYFKKQNNIKIIVVSMHPTERYALRCVQEGADGYLTKDTSPDNIIKAINMVFQGKRYLPVNIIDEIILNYSNKKNEITPHERLSNREYQIFELFANGNSTNDIASELKISVNTVNTYRSRIYEKMGINSIIELVSYAFRNNLVE
jgi:two-component system, NarL family, invasion response regulator UvrY